MIGYGRDQLIGRTVGELGICTDLERQAWPLLRAQKNVRNWSARWHPIRASCGRRWSHWKYSPGGQPHVLMIAEDLTEKRKLEAELRQAQKMEAWANWPPGWRMTSITSDDHPGHASLQLAAADLDEDVADSFKHIASAGERAANLTRQLLAFSRKQVMKPGGWTSTGW